MDKYICKIPTLNEIIKKYDYEIAHNNDIDNWEVWKEKAIERYKNNEVIYYFGILNDQIICECSAAINSKVVQNSERLINDTTAYLFAFRTIDEYQGHGYFSKLYKYMTDDLKSRGYKRLTLGVEPEELKNKEIYKKYGFTKHIKNSTEVYPDGTEVLVEYYEKQL